MIDTAVARERLQTRLGELEQRGNRLSADLREPLSADSSEQAVEKEDDAGLEAQTALIAQEIASVRRALLRIEQDSYGTCVLCGVDIAPARLAVRPEASLCIDCARLER
jgi:RNA polymerase-binding transcription factor DksA